MNPLDLVFQAISQLTGGLVHDMTTAVVAMLCLDFILMGVDWLMSVIDDRIGRHYASASLSGAESGVYASYRGLIEAQGGVWYAHHEKEVSIQLADLRYKNALRRYAVAENDYVSHDG